jgi:hypothetical protein
MGHPLICYRDKVEALFYRQSVIASISGIRTVYWREKFCGLRKPNNRPPASQYQPSLSVL